MAQMVFGEWRGDEAAKVRVTHYRADGPVFGWGKAICGIEVHCASGSDTSSRPDFVTCKRCKAAMKRKETRLKG